MFILILNFNRVVLLLQIVVFLCEDQLLNEFDVLLIVDLSISFDPIVRSLSLYYLFDLLILIRGGLLSELTDELKSLLLVLVCFNHELFSGVDKFLLVVLPYLIVLDAIDLFLEHALSLLEPDFILFV